MAAPVRVVVLHDVLCVWCFLASGRLREIRDEFGSQITWLYKTFPQSPTPEAHLLRFGSMERAKREILNQWLAVKAQPGGEAIDPDLMWSRDFEYPFSMPGLVACKCAERQGGPPAHVDMFERIQRAHVVECRNIADPAVLYELARETKVDFDRFRRDFESGEVEHEVMADAEEASRAGIYSTPSVVIDEFIIRNAVPVDQYREMITVCLASP